MPTRTQPTNKAETLAYAVCALTLSYTGEEVAAMIADKFPAEVVKSMRDEENFAEMMEAAEFFRTLVLDG